VFDRPASYVTIPGMISKLIFIEERVIDLKSITLVYVRLVINDVGHVYYRAVVSHEAGASQGYGIKQSSGISV